MIYPELNLIPDLTVAENISLGAMPRRGPFVDYRALAASARAILKEARCRECSRRAVRHACEAGHR